MSTEPEKLHISYNHVHKLCQEAAEGIRANGKPDVIVAIGGGGFIPARILRSFIKHKGEKNIPIQAIGLSLYESYGDDDVEQIGKEVIRTQWLDMGALAEHFDSLIGKNILIVDEVDDSRTTLHYALSELEKDVREVQEKLGRTSEKTTFSIFVLHNKNKPKRASLPEAMFAEGRYHAAKTVPDAWIAYPWDQMDIDAHTQKATEQGFI
ncbi:hypothetical protein BABINDRAFT_30529 [Babjeviella inositovora NRRL Y-12698]|uniref:Phosphoribosyltransferase domain-containing protein n=1 Tax=Babjeviella inositovora NRRL Y-12698 TaxID=984486 RepID=A0A1E3QZP0_9ASCO|nr:uncharacterized protein BABINDRAFT_30529 [Babjeviella inositovora NRRL Y-12698]ODQ83014.1 hypothetical protein BABINDRAFT_30529 [Babjeviella inositovora NRRL Y-12698]